MKILIITPARDEAEYLPGTIASMLAQTQLPDQWVIVNDGSRDHTAALLAELEKKAPFVKCVNVEDRGQRSPGAGVVATFNRGLAAADIKDYDVIAKFDADLEFPPDLLTRIVTAFTNDSRLGVTGPTRCEREQAGEPFKRVLVPPGFVGGPSKFYRRQCFADIGGLIPRAGWDGVDTVKAAMRGWRTGEIKSLVIRHMRLTGSAVGEGMRNACRKYGNVSYYMGGYGWYFLLRVVGRSTIARDPRVGYFMLAGYLGAWCRREAREGAEFRQFLKRIQRGNIMHWMHLNRAGDPLVELS